MASTTKTAVLTDLVLEIFRLNGRLIASGDALVAEIGLTSARWQVVGAISLQREPAPVARIADVMGLTRQSVQRIVNELEKADIVEFRPNPHHKRAKLVTLTSRGGALNDAAMRLQRPWVASLAAGIDRSALQTALDVLAGLGARLEKSTHVGDHP
jgi:DNA-binding MarR family transcriptional regulator